MHTRRIEHLETVGGMAPSPASPHSHARGVVGALTMAGMVTILSATAALAGPGRDPGTFYGAWTNQYDSGAYSFMAGSSVAATIQVSIDGDARYPLTISLHHATAVFPYGANCGQSLTMSLPDNQITLTDPQAAQQRFYTIATGMANWPSGANVQTCSGSRAPTITIQNVYASDSNARIDITWNYIGTDPSGRQTNGSYAPHDHVYGAPAPVVPEAPASVLLPISAAVLLGGGFLMWRRRRAV